MNIYLKRITAGHPDCKLIKRLYTTAFPAEERAPFWILAGKSKKEFVDFLSVRSDADFIGFVYIVNYKDLSYLFFFAVDDKYRGQGLGSRILEEVRARYSDRRLFLAIEQLDKNADNYEMRVRRKNFYQRNGFRDLNCRIREASMYYSALGTTDKEIKDEEYRCLMSRYFGKFLSLFIKTGIYKGELK